MTQNQTLAQTPVAIETRLPTRRRATRLIGTMSALAAAMVLAACGGGDDDRCAGSTTLYLSVSWTVNGVVNQSIVQGRVGQPLIADAVLSGLPASCTGKVTYSLPVDMLPPGLALNSATGRISGTATQAKSATASVTIQPEGYNTVDLPFRITITP